MSSSEWREVKLGEVCDINTSTYSQKDNWSYINYLDTGNITENKIDTIQYLDSKVDKIPSRAKRKVFKNDIIYSTVRPNQKHYGIIKEPIENMLVSTGFAVIKGKPNEVENMFIYYYLTQQHIVDSLHTIGEHSTSAYPSIKPSDIECLDLSVPPLPEQKAIAATLSCLDDKIELNNRMNKNLEEMAQAIFKSWFVDFEPFQDGEFEESELGMIPKGWRVVNVDSVTVHSCTGGDAIQKTPMVDYNTGIKCVRVGDLSNQRDIDGWGYCKVDDDNFKKYQLKKNDIIVTRTATLGLNQIVEEDLMAVFNNGLIRLRLSDEIIPTFFYFIINTDNYREYIGRIESESSTRPNMKMNYLLKYQFICPPKDIQQEFLQVVEVIRNQRLWLQKQNVTLVTTRNSLLPKLMSGEIRVPIEEVQ